MKCINFLNIFVIITAVLANDLASAVTFDCSDGSDFSTAARGINVQRYSAGTERQDSLPYGYGTSWRSMGGGGLYSDCYDWADVRKGYIYTGTPDANKNPTTLQMIKQIRDHGSTGIWTANVVGDGHFGPYDGNTCLSGYCTSQAPVYVACTMTASNDTVSCTVNHGVCVGSWFSTYMDANTDIAYCPGIRVSPINKVKFYNTVGGVSTTATYYVVTVLDSTHFKFSASPGGAIFDITGPSGYSNTRKLDGEIKFSTNVGGVTAGSTYYVLTTPTLTTFTFSSLIGGSTFNITANGSNSALTPYYTKSGWHYLPLDSSNAANNRVLLAKRAGNWVHYINYILQNYRYQYPSGPMYKWNGSSWVTNTLDTTNGNTYHDSDSTVFWSIQWLLGSYTNGLPNLGETIPKAVYWEIGNEPEIDLPGSINGHGGSTFMSTTEYSLRYQKIREYIINVDPACKTGPCVCDPTWGGSTPYLDKLVADGRAMDFVAYHPYGTVGASWPTVSSLETSLNNIKTDLDNKRNAADNYSSTLMATEFDPTMGGSYAYDTTHNSMAHALGLAESVFTFVQQSQLSLTNKIISANYWCWPATNISADVYDALRDDSLSVKGCLGNRLFGSYVDNTNKFRLYGTKWSSQNPNDIYLWGLNFNSGTAPGDHLAVSITLNNLPPASSYTWTQYELCNRGGAGYTSLIDNNLNDLYWGSWVRPETGNGATVWFQHSYLTLIVIHPNP